MLFSCLGVLILPLLICCECANILYVVPFTGKSHYIMLKPIGLELARRGHNVTVITGNKAEEDLPNYHQIMVEHKLIWDVLGNILNVHFRQYSHKLFQSQNVGTEDIIS